MEGSFYAQGYEGQEEEIIMKRKFKEFFDRATVFALVVTMLFSVVPVQVTAIDADPKIKFRNNAYYVRENNSSDTASSVDVPPTATAVQFILDGNEASPTPGVKGGVSGSYDEWRLKKALVTGAYNVTAQYYDSAEWKNVVGSSMTYSLDTAWFNYVLPSTSTNVFRPTDNPVRVSIDDEFMQFSELLVQLYHSDENGLRGLAIDSGEIVNGKSRTAFTVYRNNCDLREAKRVICDVDNAPSWLNLTQGYYVADIQTYDKARGGVRFGDAKTDSALFYVDAEKPVLSNLTIDNVNPKYPVMSKSIDVSVNALDDFALSNVKFYITEPRVSDGKCDGNGTHLVERVVASPDTDGKYKATLDTSNLNGSFCVNAIAEDVAKSHSSILRSSVEIDNVAPVVDLNNPPQGYINGTVDIVVSLEDENPRHYYFAIKDKNDKPIYSINMVDKPDYKEYNHTTLYEWDTTKVDDGEYRIIFTARDNAYNKTAVSYKEVHVVVDNEVPATVQTNPNLVTGEIYNTDVFGTLESNDGAGSGVNRIEYEVYKDGVRVLEKNIIGNTGDTDTISEEGSYVLRYRGVDNVSPNPNEEAWNSMTFTIDTTKPVITLNGDNPMEITQGSAYVDPGCLATDAFAVTCEALNPGIVDTSTPGSYVVTYQAMDTAENIETETRTVNVVAPILPAGAVALAATDDLEEGAEVAGETDESQAGEVQGGLNEQNDDDSNDNDSAAGMFGVAWYWWLIILVLAAGGSYWYFGTRRSKNNKTLK